MATKNDKMSIHQDVIHQNFYGYQTWLDGE